MLDNDTYSVGKAERQPYCILLYIVYKPNLMYIIIFTNHIDF